MRAPLFLMIALAAGCTAADTLDEVDVAADDGKADGATETRVRTGETSVWIRNEIRRETRADGREVLVVRGRASRDVTDGMAFVYDDPDGDWAKLGARSFEITYAADDGGMLDRDQHFVRLHFKPSAGRPDTLTARVVAKTALTSFTGSGAYLDADVVPVVSGGRTVWRIEGRTSSAMSDVHATHGEARKVDATHFVVDLARADVTALIGTSTAWSVTVDLASGPRTKSAKLALRLGALGLTSDDVEEVWPPLTCAEEVRACLESLPSGTTDLAACGEAREVLACQGQAGVRFDDVAYQAGFQAGLAKVASPAARADYAALAGADNVEQLQGVAEQTLEHELELLYGTFYVDTAARDAAVAAAIDRAVDLVYAHPMDALEPHAPAPGNLAGTRQVVADALLAYLETVDLEQTEFGRPLEELCRTYRSRHVADLRAWRTSVEPEDAGNGRDVYIGNWLDPYVEIKVVRATGVVENVYFEID